ncbi:MAG: hypothetical protein M3072_08955, partial [Candidatus Dormibacteraeota bacterium]|nr:hypothetical protein [Candidatus Dormibacteraeota bacterium]
MAINDGIPRSSWEWSGPIPGDVIWVRWDSDAALAVDTDLLDGSIDGKLGNDQTLRLLSLPRCQRRQ